MSGARRGLSVIQLEVARLFVGLPASEGYVLAGGAALLATELTSRPTGDLDFFRAASTVTAARDALEAAVVERGWQSRRLRDHDTFVRLQIDAGETVVVDLCLDSPPIRPPVATVVGPTFAPDELAGRKVVALFDRAEARDFADVYDLMSRYDREQLLALAEEVDAGFSRVVFIDMVRSIERHDHVLLGAGGADPESVRSAFLDWARDLEAYEERPER